MSPSRKVYVKNPCGQRKKIRVDLGNSDLSEVKNKNGSGPLIFENACTRVANTFFPQIFYQLTNIDFVLKNRVCDKFETKFNNFIARSYYM